MDDHLPAGWTSLIEAFVAHERAVASLAVETLRHRRLPMRTFAGWWEARRPGCPPQEASTGDLAAFLVAEVDRGMSAFTRKAQVAVLPPLLLVDGAHWPRCPRPDRAAARAPGRRPRRH